MAKRYHQTKKDRMHEREGMKSRLGESFYDSYDERRALERRDSEMISEDHSAIANMPQNVIMREYPKTHGYTPEDLDDTIRGIDRQMDMDNSQKMKNYMPKKV